MKAFFITGFQRKAAACLLILAAIVFMKTPLGAEEEEFSLQVYLSKKQALELAFPGADSIEKKKIWLTEAQREAISTISLLKVDDRRMDFYIGMKSGKAMGYMVIENIIGKSFPITFMIVMNVDGTVRDVEIMVYREPRGYEVRSESFMSQFFGRDAEFDYREINSITGATLSVRAITKGVRKATASFKVLFLDSSPAR
ncbi:MAG: FMN-binding protein [Candidatus Nitrohelix vancouverensis]|uniref:FMN-binding protein n=1 Tax=Candidatus Nitrohelix vancouverensis TaxID=2705534 RepID=A0A7T0G4H6_9BACT|nr:MAG: FMN-binding protein [Candidatus Nitrohelix vancouverensis]